MIIPVIAGILRAVFKSFGKKMEKPANQRKNRDHIDHSIVKIIFNTEKSPDDQTCCHSESCTRLLANPSVKNYQGEKIVIMI